jgi:hypothetical protein
MSLEGFNELRAPAWIRQAKEARKARRRLHPDVLHGRFPDGPGVWHHFLHRTFDHLHVDHHAPRAPSRAPLAARGLTTANPGRATEPEQACCSAWPG